MGCSAIHIKMLSVQWLLRCSSDLPLSLGLSKNRLLIFHVHRHRHLHRRQPILPWHRRREVFFLNERLSVCPQHDGANTTHLWQLRRQWSNNKTSYRKSLTHCEIMQGYMRWSHLKCIQTCTSLFPGQDVHPSAAEGTVRVGLGAVQDFLELFFSRLLSFHSHLQEELKCVCVIYFTASLLKMDLKVCILSSLSHTSRMVISFSFSFPALFFTCVFLVSTHTTLSFTSDLDTHTHTQAHMKLSRDLPETAF